ncbi:MAG TPA: cyclic nucleotide-binding domain-containing protein [Bdellovibrio sp.]|nr:cyclic nucleotide-binding domain-containing protein [Bdellovibrio sp.]
MNNPAKNNINPVEKENYAAGEYIFLEGDVERHFYIVESGTVGISTLGRQGQKVDLIQVKEGESFGEFALIDNSPRSASAMAVTDVQVVRVSEEGFRELLTQLPVWAHCMMKSFVERLKTTSQTIKEAESKKS